VGEELMEMERMMTSDSHSRGSERDHIRGQKKKDYKENGMRMTDKKYDKEMVEITIQLEVLMEMLQRNEKDQKYGCHEKESEVAEATREEESTREYVVNKGAEGA